MFYLSRSNNNYGIYLVGKDFLRNDWNCTDARDDDGLPEMGYTPCKIRQDYLSNPSLFENLTNAECLNIYNQDIISDFSSVIVIADFEKTCNHDNDTLPTLPCTPGVYKWGTAGIRNITGGETARLPWMCSDDPDCSQDYIDRWIKDPDTWRIEYMKITGCVSKKSHCSINFSPQLGIVVIAVNVVKAASLVLVVLLLKDQPLITIGDAIASFMRSPDPTTTNQCLTTSFDVQKTWTSTPTPYTAFHPHPRPYNPLRPRYFRALSPRLWTTWATAFTLYLSATAACLVASSRHLGSPTALPFSAPLTAANILANHGFAASVLLANAPQTLLAALYLLTNACLTRMLLAAELASYATTTARGATASRRKGLRVSSPARGTAQRGTYFLNLPLRVGTPFAGAMAGLHFLASQSVALAVVYQVDAAGAREREGDYASCSYSPLAMLCVVVGGAAVMGAVAALALGGRLAAGGPAVGSCSVAVAACCHPPEGGADERGKVAWGAVPGRWEEGAVEVVEGKVVGHCSFSSAEVEVPVAGRLYA
ncbi:uncharacterized protein P153DRAFT_368944 [Neofusicoccum parvum]|uniref:Uncharacterized protein P153DRAFT_368944 n=1 Tax=Neofusicoccum parvum TaxID=310453 RepID=A0ACB5SE92_9PEZI|nr:uncharacterized protein P153DRAFT_368944 [Neofusicoccum parvum]